MTGGKATSSSPSSHRRLLVLDLDVTVSFDPKRLSGDPQGWQLIAMAGPINVEDSTRSADSDVIGDCQRLL